MENNIERLTIKEIAPFLPYGLMGTVTDEMRLEYISYVDMVGDELITFKNAPDVYFEEIENFKPHLYPISCLTKTIQHEGREFCPIVELAKIALPHIDWILGDGIAIENTTLEPQKFGYKDEGFTTWDCHQVDPIPYQFILFQKLAEWHINFVGIPEGLYIDKQTLKS